MLAFLTNMVFCIAFTGVETKQQGHTTRGIKGVLRSDNVIVMRYQEPIAVPVANYGQVGCTWSLVYAADTYVYTTETSSKRMMQGSFTCANHPEYDGKFTYVMTPYGKGESENQTWSGGYGYESYNTTPNDLLFTLVRVICDSSNSSTIIDLEYCCEVGKYKTNQCFDNIPVLSSAHTKFWMSLPVDESLDGNNVADVLLPHRLNYITYWPLNSCKVECLGQFSGPTYAPMFVGDWTAEVQPNNGTVSFNL